MFLIREAGPADFAGVYALAKQLDSYNLPADRAYIRELLATSRDSFRGRCVRSKAKYLFVLEGKGEQGGLGRLVGCSLIIARHGTRRHPHLWFALDTLTKRSRTLRVSRTHSVLRMGHTIHGPTEIGGLIVLPAYRHCPERCGLQLAYVRFLYMAMHPGRFEPEVLIEYRGAMGKGGRSPFWESVGRLFTGLSYAQADRLSVVNKEFIRSLLPEEPIYLDLLPRNVRAAIGAVHPAAARAVRMATRIGFKQLQQIEPFDGGPYYSAKRIRVQVVRRTRRVRMGSTSENVVRGRRSGKRYLFLLGTDAGGWFRAQLAPGQLHQGRLNVETTVLNALQVRIGAAVYAYHL